MIAKLEVRRDEGPGCAAHGRILGRHFAAGGLLAGFLLAPLSVSAAGWSFEPEIGVAFPYSNDVRIPGQGGTDFSLTDELTPEKEFVWRVRLGTRFGDKHLLSVLAAPLRLQSNGYTSRPVLFEGVTYQPSEFVTATWRFDSYRLTYRYQFHESTWLRVGFGVTAKIRDAAIRIQSSSSVTEKKNTGFVPLLHFRVEAALAWSTSLLVEGDALAAPQGRAEDVLAALEWHVAPQLGLRVGYRLLEGGADNDEVYNFALVQYAVAGLRVDF